MSPIKFCHVLLIHPQTPISRSLPKAFTDQDTKTSWERSWNTPRHLGRDLGTHTHTHTHKDPGRHQDSKVQKLCQNQALKPPGTSRTSNFEYEEHLKQNHPNYLPRSQRSLELSSKASRNFKKSEIGEALRIQAAKAPKNFCHKPSNTKNIRREIIQIIFLNLKVPWN